MLLHCDRFQHKQKHKNHRKSTSSRPFRQYSFFWLCTVDMQQQKMPDFSQRFRHLVKIKPIVCFINKINVHTIFYWNGFRSTITKPTWTNSKEGKKCVHRLFMSTKKKLSSSWLPWLENIYGRKEQFITIRQSSGVLFMNSFSHHLCSVSISLLQFKSLVRETGSKMANSLGQIGCSDHDRLKQWKEHWIAIVFITFKFNSNEYTEYLCI